MVQTAYLTASEVQHLLGVSALGLRRLLRGKDGFPSPEMKDDPFAKSPEDPVWAGHAVYRWAARADGFQHRTAVLLRPPVGERQPGRRLGYRDTPYGPALDWQTEVGTVRLIYSEESGAAAQAADAAARSARDAGVAVVCTLYGDIGIGGPALVAADTAWPQIEYEANWARVVDLAGGPLPWWPMHLRLPDTIGRWRPDAPVITVDVPAEERETTLRHAARSGVFGEESVAALTDMADGIRAGRIAATQSDIRIFSGGDTGLTWPIVIPVRAADATTTRVDDKALLRAGWRDIAASADPLAVAALDVAFLTDCTLLPYGASLTIPAGKSPTAERWTRRLAPCDPTAAHAVLVADKDIDAFFVDPLTAMPVARVRAWTDEDGRSGEGLAWRFFVPLALPPGGELASIVLDRTVWAVMSDGSVHPAPCNPYKRLWWGDGWGDQPTEAAYVVNLLLDDPAAAVDFRRHWDRAPDGLTSLFANKHSNGTELSRAVLAHARMTPPR